MYTTSERGLVACSKHLNGRCLSSPTIACLAIDDRAKVNCRRRDIGYEMNCCLAFVTVPDILRNVSLDDSKRSEVSLNISL